MRCSRMMRAARNPPEWRDHEGDSRHQQRVALQRGEGRTAHALQLVPHDRVARDLDDARDKLAVARQQVTDVAGEPVREEHARVGGIRHFHTGVQRAPAQVVRAGNDIVRTEFAANVEQRAAASPEHCGGQPRTTYKSSLRDSVPITSSASRSPAPKRDASWMRGIAGMTATVGRTGDRGAGTAAGMTAGSCAPTSRSAGGAPGSPAIRPVAAPRHGLDHAMRVVAERRRASPTACTSESSVTTMPVHRRSSSSPLDTTWPAWSAR